MKIRLLHLVLVIGISTLAAGVGGVLATYWVIEDEVQDLLDDDLEAQSELLAQVLAAESGMISAERLEMLIRPIFELDQEETLWVNVYDPVSGRQVSNLDHALPPPVPGERKLNVELMGYRWFGYQHSEPDGTTVQLLHRIDRYHEVREEFLEVAAVPAAAVTVVNLLLLAGLTLLFLRPTTRLAADLERRRPDALQPLVLRTRAHEVAVLRDALNGLMADVDTVLNREREFASDVAHELRTPLTTLKLELESGRPDYAALRSEVDRLVSLVSQLLTLARLQRPQWREAMEDVNLRALCASQLLLLETIAEESQMNLHQDLDEAHVSGNPGLLEILLRNLVGNAIRHCPPGTRIDVRLHTEASTVALIIADDGPGVEPDRQAGFNAGYSRLDRRSAGLGLGLAICQKIAEVHGATLEFRNRQDGRSGLEVVVRFAILMSA
ncbi:MAG: ATP-binding protein [Pseudomonadales bacterium]